MQPSSPAYNAPRTGDAIGRRWVATGRLGPVCDSEAMADNIMAVLKSDRQMMADRARAEALRFSWDHSMEALFGRFYPAALARCTRARVQLASPAAAPLVRA